MNKKMKTEQDLDPGVFPGVLIVFLVLVVWGSSKVTFGEEPTAVPGGLNPASSETSEWSVPGSETPRPISDLEPSTPAGSLDSEGDSFRDDPRWKRAGEIGDTAMVSYQADLKESEEVGGINLLASRKDLRDRLEEAISLLVGMEAEFADNQVASEQIERRRNRFRKNLGFTVGK